MFDLITERTERPFRKPALVPRILSTTLHVFVVALVIAIPLLTVTNALPEAPSIMAFVADAPAPPPPPPPPAAAKPATPEPPKPASASAAPIEAPTEITPAPAADIASASAGVIARVEGGIDGGELGGLASGIVGGIVEAPPPPPAAQAPVRIGGRITAPALLHRVDPLYSAIASGARLAGVVILEAVVDTGGCVQSVKVARSAHPVLDREAVQALKQWRYEPLILNGDPAAFVLTVTFNFNAGH